MHDRTSADQPRTASPEIKTALYYWDDFADLKIFWRIGPTILLGSLSWAGIHYFLFI